MICEIVKDVKFLKKESVPADENDISIAKDLIDTLRANQKFCVGMAANMIGKNKSIIAFFQEEMITVMLNPEIVEKSDTYFIREGCLSLKGERTALRYQNITVAFWDLHFRKHTRKYSGKTSQIIQHEMDHLKGILI